MSQVGADNSPIVVETAVGCHMTAARETFVALAAITIMTEI